MRSRRILVEAVERRVLMSAGQLDPSFGTDGTVVIGSPGGVPITSAIAVGIDGRQVVADTYGPSASAPLSQDTTIVTRYDLTGAPDPTFGVGGTVTLPGELVNKVLIRPAGPIDIVGSKLQQLTVTGAVQANFASGGLTLSSPATSEVLQTDGKLLITGPGLPGVMRFNLDGSADDSFADAGVYPASGEAPLAVALDSSGRILLGTGRVLARLTPAGILDTTFGTSGSFTGPSLGAFNGAHFSPTKSNLAVGPDGTIYLFSEAQSGLAPMRGGVDALFVVSSNGQVGTEIDPPTTENIVTADGLAVQADGKILLLATTDANQLPPGGSSTVLRRYMPVSGTSTTLVLDTTFNSTGEVKLNFATHVALANYSLAVDDRAAGLAIGPNGGITSSRPRSTPGTRSTVS